MATFSVCVFHWVPSDLTESKEKTMLWQHWSLSLVVWCQLSSLREYNINLFFFTLCVIGMGISSTSRTIYGLIVICKRKSPAS